MWISHSTKIIEYGQLKISRDMEDILINYTIKFYKGKYKGQTLEIEIDLDDIECEDLAGVLIEEGYLDSYCNDDEFEVIARTIK